MPLRPAVIYEPSEPQELALDHLRFNDRAALFMGCGLGKTAVVLHRLAELFDDGACEGALVVAPMRVANLVWPAEAAKWDSTRHLRIANLRTPEGMAALEAGRAHLYVINYDQLQQFQARYLHGRRRVAFDTVVWDEITRAKNHESKRINIVRPYIHRHCKRHWGLTGTPSPNGLLDLFAQIRLLDEGARLGKAYTAYRDCYFEAVDYDQRKWVPLANARERIYARLEGFALTLRSSDWLDIPDVNQEDIEVPFPKEIAGQYQELEEELCTLLDSGATITAINAGVLTNKLLQLTSGAVYDEEKRVHVLHSAKLDAARRFIDSNRGSPILVGCNYIHEQDRLATVLPQAIRFDSAKSHKQQLDLEAKWNAGKIPVLLAHPASIGHGLNLQAGGSTVLWFTLPWSPELYDQFNARVARRGQDQVTRIVRLMVKGSMDEGVAEALRGKDREQSALLDALKVWRNSLL